MSSVVIAGDSSGSVTLQAPSVAGSTVLTLPSTSGTILTTASSGGAVPAAGSNNYVQYNSSGVLAGTSGLQISGGVPVAYTGSTGTANLLAFQMGGTRTAGNNWGMYWADSAGETNAALWASYTGGNNAAALVFGTNSGTGGSSGIGSTTERMRIDASGNVKLSTASTSILNSSGNIMLSQTGAILQVVNATTTTQISATNADVTTYNFQCAITPKSTTSKIIAFISVNGIDSGGSGRMSTYLIVGTTGGDTSGTQVMNTQVANNGTSTNGMMSTSFSYLSGATGSTTTQYYKVCASKNDGSATWYVQRFNVYSTITLMEIAA